MSANAFVILALLGLGVFVLYQFYRIFSIMRSSSDREQRFNHLMIIEQARIEALKRKAEQAAQVVPASSIGHAAPEDDQRLGLSA
ncbi:hypothetical protein IFT48_03885 [Pseudomonas fluorescens]|uniref:hypothetical protein n=1 Tax=Pseudomonas TaxID=286 RepID=UPI000F0149E2|nr:MULTISPECIES: hypothetical protein [Pseudomonas]MBD8089111.1 hypothetical protein [Pseudomonas fluorescens]MBD8615463.1 hypothetical protein [Pseudomonas putida]MBD8681884.1 hypothetical protein [Pseudomonas sp. CFBP 13719]